MSLSKHHDHRHPEMKKETIPGEKYVQLYLKYRHRMELLDEAGERALEWNNKNGRAMKFTPRNQINFATDVKLKMLQFPCE